MLNSNFTYFIQFANGNTGKKLFFKTGWVRLYIALWLLDTRMLSQTIISSYSLSTVHDVPAFWWLFIASKWWKKDRFSAQCFSLNSERKVPSVFIVELSTTAPPHYLKQLESNTDTVRLCFAEIHVLFVITNTLGFMGCQWTSTAAYNKNQSISYWRGMLKRCLNSKLCKGTNSKNNASSERLSTYSRGTLDLPLSLRGHGVVKKKG